MDEIVLFSFKGKGTLNVIGNTSIKIPVEFSIQQFNNTKVNIELQALHTSIIELLEYSQNKNLLPYKLTGELDGNKCLEIPCVYINRLNFSIGKDSSCKTTMLVTHFSEIYIWDKELGEDYNALFKYEGNLTIGLTNFVFNGNIYSQYQDGSRRLDTFSIPIEGREIRLKHVCDYTTIEKILKEKRGILLTSEMYINNIKYEEVKESVSDVLWLLSYSQKTFISKVFTKIVFKNEKTVLIIHNYKKYRYVDSSFISTHNGSDLELFLLNAYPFFKIKKSQLKLMNIFDILCQAEIANVLESKYLLLSVALELLVDKLIYDENLIVDCNVNQINKISDTIRNCFPNSSIPLSNDQLITISKKLTQPLFKDKINVVINSLSLNYSDDEISRIKKNRDKIVHEVRFVDYTHPIQEVKAIKQLIDKILLKKMNYPGNVLNYSNDFSYEKII